jgi:hypothetical protein
MKRIGGTVALLVAFGVSHAAGQNTDREKLLGSWASQNQTGETTVVWTFGKAGDAFQITLLEGNNKVTDYSCKADGQECEIKTSGKKAKISMWFNGPALVQLETQGSNVVKRRFEVGLQGDTMKLEVIPVVPSGETEVIEFKRTQISARSN